MFSKIKNVIVFDTETVGIRDKQLLEIAAASLSITRNGFVEQQEKKRFESIIKGNNNISKSLLDFQSFVSNEPRLFIAHNICFDIAVLKNNGFTGYLEEDIHLCSLKVIRQMNDEIFPYPYLMDKTSKGKLSKNLSSVYAGLFGNRFTNAHTALADVNALCKIVLHPSFSQTINKIYPHAFDR